MKLLKHSPRTLLVLVLLTGACSREEPRIAREVPASQEVIAAVDRALAAAGVSGAPEAPIDDKSIAVLPFSDLSENGDQAYFAQGLSHHLMNRLATIPEMQVAGRESSFYFQDRDAMPSDIGEALQVANMLRGSVSRSGNNLRVTTQLVRADGDDEIVESTEIWSQTFEGELADVFAIQDEIVAAVLSALNVTRNPGELVVSGMTNDTDAYDSLLQAQALYHQFSPDNVISAINLLEEAVQIDSRFGQAWLMLGTIYDESQLILSQGQAMDFPAQAALAFAQAEQQAPQMPALMLVEAGKLRDAGRFLEAENMYQQYFAQYGYSMARAMEEYGHMLARTGQFNEAIAMFNRARRADPFSPRFIYQLALHELVRGQTPEATRLTAYGMELDSEELLFHALEWQVAMREGELDEAAALIREYFEFRQNNEDSIISRQFMETFADILELNDFDTSTDAIIDMINDPSVSPLELGYVARLVALMGQPEIALDYFFAGEADAAVWDKVYDDMRRLPDFNRLLQEKGMVDYWRETGKWGDFCVAAGGRDFVCK